jgi:hypothetical protein
VNVRALASRWPLPCVLALGSSIAAAIAATLVLATTPAQGATGLHQHGANDTPEHAAEAFVTAYCHADLEGAAEHAGKRLARGLRHSARSTKLVRLPSRSLVIEESHTLTKSRMRLVGLLVRDDAPDAPGLPIELIMEETEDGFVVDDLTWPDGAPRHVPTDAPKVAP